MSNLVRFTREELYALVWSKPTTEIAREIGVSDVAVAKACQRHSIPKPPLGYWAKVQSGQKMGAQPPLPEKPENCASVVTFWDEQRNYARSMAKKQISTEDMGPKIIPVEDLRSAHSLITKTKSALVGVQADKYGRVHPKKQESLDLNISKENIQRALIIWETIARACESRGYRLEAIENRDHWVTPGTWETFIVIGEEKIRVKMEERSDRSERPPTEREKKWSYYDKWVYKPSGALSLLIDSYPSDEVQRAWTDRKKERLEDKLNDFLAGILRHANASKAQKIERQQAAEESDRRAKRLAEEKRLHDLELSRQRSLEDDFQRWTKSRELLDFIVAIEAETKRENLEDQDLLKWLSWARLYARKINPIEKLIQGNLPNLDGIE